MKPVARVLDGEGNLGGEKIGMTIDDAAMQHIMSVLTDLYSDPELAVIREYSTNALDSHRDAGQTRPIEVTLPSALSPFFRVRDYGIGLDADDIRNIYSRYGTSTKRDSNDVVGMLGLGCKSALTYTDQFTLTGIKDGRMVQVAIGRDEDGGGSMTIVADEASDAPEGAEVIVPVKRHNAFEAKAFEFFKFWQEGTVLVNGEKPERVDGMWISDTICLAQNTKPVVVMGNVAYPLPGDDATSYGGRKLGDWTFGNSYSRWYGTVAYVGIGDIQFTPSREALQMTKLTKETLTKLKQDVQSKLDDSLAKQVEDAPTPMDAVRKMQDALAINPKMRDVLYQGRLVPKGALVRDTKTSSGITDERNGFLTYAFSSYGRKTGEWAASVGIEQAADAIWFTNFEDAELSKHKRDKLDVFLNTHGEAWGKMIFVRSMTSDEAYWTKGAKVYDWDDVAAIKLTTSNMKLMSGKPRGSYNARVDGRWTEKLLAADIDTKRPIVWHHGNQWTVEGTSEMRSGLIPSNAYVIALQGNRIEKFLRDFPTALSLREFIQKEAAKRVAAISDDVWKAYAFKTEYGQALAGLDASRVDDPTLKERIELVNVDTAKAKAIATGALRYWLTGDKLTNKLPDPFVHYPLLRAERRYGSRQIGSKELNHAYLYINAAYAAEKEGQ